MKYRARLTGLIAGIHSLGGGQYCCSCIVEAYTINLDAEPYKIRAYIVHRKVYCRGKLNIPFKGSASISLTACERIRSNKNTEYSA